MKCLYCETALDETDVQVERTDAFTVCMNCGAEGPVATIGCREQPVSPDQLTKEAIQLHAEAEERIAKNREGLEQELNEQHDLVAELRQRADSLEDDLRQESEKRMLLENEWYPVEAELRSIVTDGVVDVNADEPGGFVDVVVDLRESLMAAQGINRGLKSHADYRAQLEDLLRAWDSTCQGMHVRPRITQELCNAFGDARVLLRQQPRQTLSRGENDHRQRLLRLLSEPVLTDLASRVLSVASTEGFSKLPRPRQVQRLAKRCGEILGTAARIATKAAPVTYAASAQGSGEATATEQGTVVGLLSGREVSTFEALPALKEALEDILEELQDCETNLQVTDHACRQRGTTAYNIAWNALNPGFKRKVGGAQTPTARRQSFRLDEWHGDVEEMPEGHFRAHLSGCISVLIQLQPEGHPKGPFQIEVIRDDGHKNEALPRDVHPSAKFRLASNILDLVQCGDFFQRAPRRERVARIEDVLEDFFSEQPDYRSLLEELVGAWDACIDGFGAVPRRFVDALRVARGGLSVARGPEVAGHSMPHQDGTANVCPTCGLPDYRRLLEGLLGAWDEAAQAQLLVGVPKRLTDMIATARLAIRSDGIRIATSTPDNDTYQERDAALRAVLHQLRTAGTAPAHLAPLEQALERGRRLQDRLQTLTGLDNPHAALDELRSRLQRSEKWLENPILRLHEDDTQRRALSDLRQALHAHRDHPPLHIPLDILNKASLVLGDLLTRTQREESPEASGGLSGTHSDTKDAVSQALDEAPLDDEPVTEQERLEIGVARSEAAQGLGITTAELKRRLHLHKSRPNEVAADLPAGWRATKSGYWRNEDGMRLHFDGCYWRAARTDYLDVEQHWADSMAAMRDLNAWYPPNVDARWTIGDDNRYNTSKAMQVCEATVVHLLKNHRLDEPLECRAGLIIAQLAHVHGLRPPGAHAELAAQLEEFRSTADEVLNSKSEQHVLLVWVAAKFDVLVTALRG